MEKICCGCSCCTCGGLTRRSRERAYDLTCAVEVAYAAIEGRQALRGIEFILLSGHSIHVQIDEHKRVSKGRYQMHWM